MPLTRAKTQFLANPDGVEFLMSDGTKEVLCWVEQEFLRYQFESRDLLGDSDVFEINRAAIEQAASDKYDAAPADLSAQARLTVTGADIASPLSRKM